MADLETRVDKLEEKVKELELDITKSLDDLKNDMTEIKTILEKDTNVSDLQKEVISKDILSNTTRIKKLEDTQSKFFWLIVGEIVTVVGGLIVAAIKFF